MNSFYNSIFSKNIKSRNLLDCACERVSIKMKKNICYKSISLKSRKHENIFNEVGRSTILEHPAIIQMKNYYLENDQKIILFGKCQCNLFDYRQLKETFSITEI
jgi:hypothetical protein